MLLSNRDSLFCLLEEKFDFFNKPDFIKNDPISIPHQFVRKEDIEISAFLTATIAWGQRITIIQNAKRIMQMMENQPYNFILHADEKDLLRFDKFVHRTFNSEDCKYFLLSLKNIYTFNNGLEDVFNQMYKETEDIFETIIRFRSLFLNLPHFQRTEKHISNPEKGSAAKRLNMFLRWMVRDDN